MNIAGFSHGSRMQLWFFCEGKKNSGSWMTAPSAGALAALLSLKLKHQTLEQHGSWLH